MANRGDGAVSISHRRDVGMLFGLHVRNEMDHRDLTVIIFGGSFFVDVYEELRLKCIDLILI